MLTFGATSAQAWYFPEHVELTRLALRDFAPHFVSEEIDKVLIDAKAEGLVVCGGPFGLPPFRRAVFVTGHADRLPPL